MKPAQPGKEPALTINQFHYEVVKRFKFLDLIKAPGLRNCDEFRGPVLIKESEWITTLILKVLQIMPRKKQHITITDQFCGAGGSSQGVRRYSERSNGGVEVKLALNHWKLAIMPSLRFSRQEVKICKHLKTK